MAPFREGKTATAFHKFDTVKCSFSIEVIKDAIHSNECQNRNPSYSAKIEDFLRHYVEPSGRDLLPFIVEIFVKHLICQMNFDSVGG